MTEIKIPAGIFTINRYEMPEGYTSFKKAEIEQISAEHIRIITMDQEVEWKEQKFSPVVYQSCMDPDNITVYPLEIECVGKKADVFPAVTAAGADRSQEDIDNFANDFLDLNKIAQMCRK